MQKIEYTLSTLEVSEMLETEHWQLLRKLEGDKRTKGIITILTDNNFGVSDYFIPSTYKDASGKENKCYQVTKLGCDFLANKFTGEKGVLFTARYVKRFREMEEQIANPFEGLSTELKAVIVVDKRVTKMEERIERLEFDIPLYGSEADELCSHVKRKGVEVMGGKQTNAYKDTKVRAAVYSDIYNQIKREFGLYDDKGRFTSYKALKRKYIYEAHELIDCYALPTYLHEQIRDCNAQESMEVA